VRLFGPAASPSPSQPPSLPPPTPPPSPPSHQRSPSDPTLRTTVAATTVSRGGNGGRGGRGGGGSGAPPPPTASHPPPAAARVADRQPSPLSTRSITAPSRPLGARDGSPTWMRGRDVSLSPDLNQRRRASSNGRSLEEAGERGRPPPPAHTVPTDAEANEAVARRPVTMRTITCRNHVHMHMHTGCGCMPSCVYAFRWLGVTPHCGSCCEGRSPWGRWRVRRAIGLQPIGARVAGSHTYGCRSSWAWWALWTGRASRRRMWWRTSSTQASASCTCPRRTSGVPRPSATSWASRRIGTRAYVSATRAVEATPSHAPLRRGSSSCRAASPR
jgi:hypothetical protein